LRFLLSAFIAGESLLLFLPQLPNESLWLGLLTSLGICLLFIAFLRLIKHQLLNKVSFLIWVYILFALGFIWSGYLTQERINNDLPQYLEGVPLLVEGVVDGLPSQGTKSLRFSITVESVASDDELIQVDLQHFPKRLSLGWYPGWRGEGVLPEIKPGQRWRLPVVLKRAHGLMNPL
jgi:competence protein ComEC